MEHILSSVLLFVGADDAEHVVSAVSPAFVRSPRFTSLWRELAFGYFQQRSYVRQSVVDRIRCGVSGEEAVRMDKVDCAEHRITLSELVSFEWWLCERLFRFVARAQVLICVDSDAWDDAPPIYWSVRSPDTDTDAAFSPAWEGEDDCAFAKTRCIDSDRNCDSNNDKTSWSGDIRCVWLCQPGCEGAASTCLSVHRTSQGGFLLSDGSLQFQSFPPSQALLPSHLSPPLLSQEKPLVPTAEEPGGLCFLGSESPDAPATDI